MSFSNTKLIASPMGTPPILDQQPLLKQLKGPQAAPASPTVNPNVCSSASGTRTLQLHTSN